VSDISYPPGQVAVLALQLSDGNGDVYPKASIFSDSGAAAGVIDMTHVGGGLYTGQWQPPCPGRYLASYRVFLDQAGTVESDYEMALDGLVIRKWDPPSLGVAYEESSQTLRLETGLSRDGEPVPPPAVISATVTLMDADDSVLTQASDPAPDGQGVFRLQVQSPGLIPDRLYSVTVAIDTSCGQVVTRRGFMTTV